MLGTLAALIVAQSISVSAAPTVRAESFRYRFDNPSTFDSPTPVPHFFEQKYDTIPLWLGADARYQLGGIPMQTSVAFSRRARTRGSDIDTFFLTSGDIATSGTDGHVTLGSFDVSHRMTIAEALGWTVGFSSRFRRDRADFLPDDRIVTHTKPASITREFITDNETTVSQVLAFGATAQRSHALGGRWQAEVSATVEPFVRGRLSIKLPQKYPDIDLVYYALSAAGRVDAALVRRLDSWHIGVHVFAAVGHGYRRTPTYAFTSVGAAVFAGIGRR